MKEKQGNSKLNYKRVNKQYRENKELYNTMSLEKGKKCKSCKNFKYCKNLNVPKPYITLRKIQKKIKE